MPQLAFDQNRLLVAQRSKLNPKNLTDRKAIPFFQSRNHPQPPCRKVCQLSLPVAICRYYTGFLQKPPVPKKNLYIQIFRNRLPLIGPSRNLFYPMRPFQKNFPILTFQNR